MILTSLFLQYRSITIIPWNNTALHNFVFIVTIVIDSLEHYGYITMVAKHDQHCSMADLCCLVIMLAGLMSLRRMNIVLILLYIKKFITLHLQCSNYLSWMPQPAIIFFKFGNKKYINVSYLYTQYWNLVNIWSL